MILWLKPDSTGLPGPRLETSGYVDAALHDPGPATHDTGALVQVI